MDERLKEEAMLKLLIALKNDALENYIFGIGRYGIRVRDEKGNVVTSPYYPIETIFEYSKKDLSILDKAKKSMQNIADTFRDIDYLFRITQIAFYTDYYQNSHDVPKKIEIGDVLESVRQNIIRNSELYSNDKAHYDKYIAYDNKYSEKVGAKIIH